MEATTKMNLHENAAVVVELVRQLRSKGSWCGITHLQKAAYFLKALTGVPISSDFILYKHGPFASPFQSLVSHMLAHRLLERVPRDPPYGPSLEPGPRAPLLLNEYGPAAERFARETSFVSDRLADKGVVELEKLGTALWVTLNRPEAVSVEERAREITELKKHISREEAEEAVRKVDRLQQEWTQASSS